MFINVPNVTMVYISAFDIFKKGKTIYHCKTVVKETGEAVDNGLMEVYVNTVINVEDYAKEMALENVKKLFENECNLDVVIASFKNIPKKMIRKLYEEVVSKKALV